MDKNLKVDNKGVKVKVLTIDGKSTTGHLNILGFDRLSDYLQRHNENFILLYKGGLDENKTLFILKTNVILIEDLDA